MTNSTGSSGEVFSFHLANFPVSKVPRFLLCPEYKQKVPGLNHSESFITMNLGESIVSAPRYNLKAVAFLAWWSEEAFLSEFLKQPTHKCFQDGWHVSLKLYRRWGEVAAFKDATVDPLQYEPGTPVVAVTLARLKIREVTRFAKWGKPVESQVRDHPGKNLALAAMRPLNTFSTFSIWKNESEMLSMVDGRDTQHDLNSHKMAMQERLRRDFHHEFTTMRFRPVNEVGTWNGKSDYTLNHFKTRT